MTANIIAYWAIMRLWNSCLFACDYIVDASTAHEEAWNALSEREKQYAQFVALTIPHWIEQIAS